MEYLRCQLLLDLFAINLLSPDLVLALGRQCYVGPWFGGLAGFNLFVDRHFSARCGAVVVAIITSRATKLMT